MLAMSDSKRITAMKYYNVRLEVDGEKMAMLHTVKAVNELEAVAVAVQEEIRVSGFAVVGMVHVLNVDCDENERE